MRDRDSQEVNSAPLLTLQPTQTSPILPSFSDLKDSNDEGLHQQLQSVSKIMFIIKAFLNEGMLHFVHPRFS